jgi:methionyl-tRNA formyltransferase
MEARGDALTVSCGGSTALRLVEVQLEGKQRVGARDFINGSHARAGESLG